MQSTRIAIVKLTAKCNFSLLSDAKALKLLAMVLVHLTQNSLAKMLFFYNSLLVFLLLQLFQLFSSVSGTIETQLSITQSNYTLFCHQSANTYFDADARAMPVSFLCVSFLFVYYTKIYHTLHLWILFLFERKTHFYMPHKIQFKNTARPHCKCNQTDAYII